MKKIALLCVAFAGLLGAQSGNLTMYWIDTEGGAATLIVGPSGQSLLVDTGNPGTDDRDAKRILDVPKDPDKTENQRSVGFLLTFGNFKFLNMGDLTWDKEMELACPVNKLGTVTLFQATHHGFYGDYSGAPALVWAIKPQVVVVNN